MADDEDNREETGSMPSAEPGEPSISALICARTGLQFQSSAAMKLLSLYDDGISPPVAMAPLPTESVICRICREGLHDDADEELPAAEGEEAHIRATNAGAFNVDLGDAHRGVDPAPDVQGPIFPHPVMNLNNEAAQNPMLAPCECAGSMAFVHYLCIEQWRCRSRHPNARNGLNCETCGSAYALPPPTHRDASVDVPQNREDWLEAMPPHVLEAMRNPHIWWQISYAMVQRRWLRPVAPVLMSPIVALYCRARRLLKKRGVARRRWACSLCRRRARWKCVRCLRSYYCSRQCQNVSWHIVHKHVCYKPSRFRWSVLVYSALAVLLFPGILQDPFMYELGFLSVPLAFIISGFVGGAAAALTKKVTGVDTRGRLLEFAVLVATVCLSILFWGLIRGFFGDPQACYGVLGSYQITMEDLQSTRSIVQVFHTLVLKPLSAFYLFLDGVVFQHGGLLKRFLCVRSGVTEGCFKHLPHTNNQFFLEEEGGHQCAGDLVVALTLLQAAGLSFILTTLNKHTERRQRRDRGGNRHQNPPAWNNNFVVPPHQHQD